MWRVAVRRTLRARHWSYLEEPCALISSDFLQWWISRLLWSRVEARMEVFGGVRQIEVRAVVGAMEALSSEREREAQRLFWWLTQMFVIPKECRLSHLCPCSSHRLLHLRASVFMCKNKRQRTGLAIELWLMARWGRTATGHLEKWVNPYLAPLPLLGKTTQTFAIRYTRKLLSLQ